MPKKKVLEAALDYDVGETVRALSIGIDQGERLHVVATIPEGILQ